jgi:hypothetical protein
MIPPGTTYPFFLVLDEVGTLVAGNLPATLEVVWTMVANWVMEAVPIVVAGRHAQLFQSAKLNESPSE